MLTKYPLIPLHTKTYPTVFLVQRDGLALDNVLWETVCKLLYEAWKPCLFFSFSLSMHQVITHTHVEKKTQTSQCLVVS